MNVTELNDIERARAIDAILDGLPKLECRGMCQESCGPVFMSRVEWRRIIDRLGYAPKGDATMACPMLGRKDGRCRVYDIRPGICRLWGLVASMPCPFGCVPEGGLLSDADGHEVLRRIEEISGP